MYNNYIDDNESFERGGSTSLSFGLNNAMLIAAEYNPAVGDKGEYFNVEFLVKTSPEDEGTKVNKRLYAITRVKADGVEITDPLNPAFQKALNLQKGFFTHLFSCFADKARIQQEFQARNPQNFNQFCSVYTSLLPQNYSTIRLHLFLEYEYALSRNNDRTFLRIPSNRKHGKFVVAASSFPGKWNLVKAENPADNDDFAIKYISETDPSLIHAFERSGWYANSPFSNQLKGNANSPVASVGGAAIATPTISATPSAPVTTPTTAAPAQPQQTTTPPVDTSW